MYDINPRTEDISNNIKLDREKQEQYELHVEAYDNGEKPLTGADQGYKFTRILTINITENSHTKVVRVETIHKGTGENAEVKFELDKNPGLKFSDLAFLSKQSQSLLKSRSPPCRNRCGSRWGGLLLPDGPQHPAGLRDRQGNRGDLRARRCIERSRTGSS